VISAKSSFSSFSSQNLFRDRVVETRLLNLCLFSRSRISVALLKNGLFFLEMKGRKMWNSLCRRSAQEGQKGLNFFSLSLLLSLLILDDL